MTVARWPIVLTGSLLLVSAGALRVGATVEMQVQAKKLGFAARSCLYCHASPHAVEAMKKRAKDLAMAEGNCLACHGTSIPAALNHRGEWLVQEKARRGAKACDMAWLEDYKEPVTTKPSQAKPTPKPETIQVVPTP